MSERDELRRADDAWLFDGGRAPDEASARLERLLSLHGLREPAGFEATFASARGRRRALLCAAAVLLLGLPFALLALQPRGEGYVVHAPEGDRLVRAGGRIETGGSGAWIEVAEIGDIQLALGSRLRVLARAAGRHRFYLERGALVASISAEPRAFQVDTPSGSSVDLGCFYELDVDEAGVTRLVVVSGRVAFEDAESGRSVYVPGGASCEARPGRGPSSPVWNDSDPRWRQALARLDFADEPDADLLSELDRCSDSLGLWHLLGAPSSVVRAAAYDRLAQLVPPPQEAVRAAIVASADASAGSPSRVARRSWLELMNWYSFDW